MQEGIMYLLHMEQVPGHPRILMYILMIVACLSRTIMALKPTPAQSVA